MYRPLARGGRAPAAVLALAVALLKPAPAPAASYPPQYHFQTVSTDRVSVHFHQGFEATARQAASMATDILSRHEARYGQKVRHVQIVIVDAEDAPNGFSTPLPFPLVTIRAVAPDGTDDFGNHEGWLRLVLTHELAHTVHLEEARGIWGFGRKVFGRAPFLFPNTVAMSWMIEGLATYEETELTAFGRGRDADSRMVLRMAALEGKFPKEDQAIYALDAWPGGETPYLFGEAFLRRLSEQAGEDTIPRMGRQHAVQFPPFLDGRTARKVTGTGLHAHWQAWAQQATEAFERDAEERGAQGLTPSRPVTGRGIRQVAPRFSPDGTWVAYTSNTLTRFPEIRLARPDGTEDRRLVQRNGGSGLAWTPDGKGLVYAEVQVHRTFSVFGDLSLVDVATGDVRRLTRGAARLRPRRLARRPHHRLRAEEGGPLGPLHDRPGRQGPEAAHELGRGRRVERPALEPARGRDRGRAPPAGRLARPRARGPGHGRRRAAHPRPGEGRGAHVDAGRGGRRLPLRPRRRLEPLHPAPRRPLAHPRHQRPRRRLPALGQPRRPLGGLLRLLLPRVRRPRRAARPSRRRRRRRPSRTASRPRAPIPRPPPLP